ncbi:MAG: UDP-N-acetylmuramate--L-alanine ligase [Clostridia bacterium]|nr:UDP-N-acetylmuramate--L-alanine ligase [Clostridia bacterium]
MAKYYFLGIGGISMSALAIFLKFSGEIVCGSDLTYSENLKNLEKFNIPFYIEHKTENIKNFNPDFVVINCAIKKNNEEYLWAKNNKIKIITRAKLLGLFAKNFKNTISIAGTHGKTTTVAMISEIFLNAGLKPTIHIGGILNKTKSNFVLGDNKFFITEACEYKDSFLKLKSKVGAVTNIEADHMDYFKNFDQLKNSFDRFLKNSKIKIFKNNDEDYSYLFQTSKKQFNFCAKNIYLTKNGITFKYFENNNFLASFRLNSFGIHNVNNAIIAIKIALLYKIPLQIIKRTLKEYCGVERRFELIGKIENTIIIHDYAHHPTEIEKVISQAKNYGKVLTVFQPHTYSRTKKLFAGFLKAFDESDEVLFFKTYPARESEKEGYSAKKLFESLKEKIPCQYFDDEQKLLEEIKQKAKNFDVILILGAGDINLIAKKLIK